MFLQSHNNMPKAPLTGLKLVPIQKLTVPFTQDQADFNRFLPLMTFFNSNLMDVHGYDFL